MVKYTSWFVNRFFLFSLGGILAENNANRSKTPCYSVFATMKAWEGLDWFFVKRRLNRMGPLESSQVREVFQVFIGIQSAQNIVEVEFHSGFFSEIPFLTVF